MKKVFLSSVMLISALLFSSCGAVPGVATDSTSSSSSAWGAGGSCTVKPGTANAICTDYATLDASSIKTGCGNGSSSSTYSSGGCSTTGMIGKCVSSYAATYYGSAYSSSGSSICNDTWTSLSGGSTGSCSDPSLVGSWTCDTGSTWAFSTSTVTNNPASYPGCTLTFSYDTCGGKLNLTLTSLSSSCTATGTTAASFAYSFSGTQLNLPGATCYK